MGVITTCFYCKNSLSALNVFAHSLRLSSVAASGSLRNVQIGSLLYHPDSKNLIPISGRSPA